MRRIVKIFKILRIIIVTVFFLYTIALLVALFYTSKAAGVVCLLFVLGIIYLYIQFKNRVKRAFTRGYIPESPDNTPKPFKKTLALPNIDDMTGQEFELFCAKVLLNNGFKEVRTTPITNDYGADLVAKDSKNNTWVFQCKRYNKSVDGSAVQEVIAAKPIYNAQVAAVMTNSRLTSNAHLLAKKNGVYVFENVKGVILDPKPKPKQKPKPYSLEEMYFYDHF